MICQTLRDLKETINNIDEELLDKPVYIIAPNGLFLTPQIKFKVKDSALLGEKLTKENVDSIYIVND